MILTIAVLSCALGHNHGIHLGIILLIYALHVAVLVHMLITIRELDCVWKYVLAATMLMVCLMSAPMIALEIIVRNLVFYIVSPLTLGLIGKLTDVRIDAQAMTH